MLFLNKTAQTVCIEVSSQNILFLPFFPLFYGEVMQPTTKIWPYSSSATQNLYESIVCFSFCENFHFNGHFRHFGRPYWMEETNGERWFAIPYNADSWRAKYVNLKKIAQKLKTWECRLRNHEKKLLWRHQIKISKKWEKCHLKF